MGTFIVSFLVFAGAAALLQLGQVLRKGPLPVGCTPGSGECCMDPEGPLGDCGKPGGRIDEKGGNLFGEAISPRDAQRTRTSTE